MLSNLKDNLCTYYIRDNGGIPFKVNIFAENNVYQVKIYTQNGYPEESYVDSNDSNNSKCSEESETTVYNYYSDEILTFEVNNYFIGKSELDSITACCKMYGPKYDGNTILLHIKDNEYVFIGITIFSFTSIEPIVDYSSPVGSNVVPYPYAVDANGNAYLLIENVIIMSNNKIRDQIQSYDNMYRYYYDYHRITKCTEKNIRNKLKKFFKCPIKGLKNPYFMDIAEFYIEDDEYDLTYDPFPEKDYDRLVEHIGSPLSIVDINNKKHILSKEDFVHVIKSFGAFNSFAPLIITHTYQERLF